MPDLILFNLTTGFPSVGSWHLQTPATYVHTRHSAHWIMLIWIYVAMLPSDLPLEKKIAFSLLHIGLVPDSSQAIYCYVCCLPIFGFCSFGKSFCSGIEFFFSVLRTTAICLLKWQITRTGSVFFDGYNINSAGAHIWYLDTEMRYQVRHQHFFLLWNRISGLIWRLLRHHWFHLLLLSYRVVLSWQYISEVLFRTHFI